MKVHVSTNLCKDTRMMLYPAVLARPLLYPSLLVLRKQYHCQFKKHFAFKNILLLRKNLRG